jgi:phosphoribosyl-dephospho-CoA transferase
MATELEMKNLRPHDLLRLLNASAFADLPTFPEWARESLRANPFVVVRRAIAPDGFVPVGIRGPERNQRLATLLPASAIEQHFAPEDLSPIQLWIDSALPTAHFAALKTVVEAAGREALVWGPIGSAGFQLATKARALRPESDLDILVRYSSRISTEALRSFQHSLLTVPIRVDVSLEAYGSAAALDEFLKFPHRVLIKTPNGPELGSLAA